MPTHRYLKSFCVALSVLAAFGPPLARAETNVTVVNGFGNIVQSSTGNHSSNVVVIDGQQYVPTKTVTGPRKTEVRNLAPFSVVDLAAPADATFTISPRSTVSISGPAEVLPKVVTTIHDGRLYISTSGNLVLSQPLVVNITGPSLGGVGVEGSGTVKLTLPDANTLDLRVAGSGSIAAAGKVSRLNVNISGSGDVDASAMRAKALDSNVSGTGDVRAWASEQANVEVTGSGDVQVLGKPARRTVNRFGSGDVDFD